MVCCRAVVVGVVIYKREQVNIPGWVEAEFFATSYSRGWGRITLQLGTTSFSVSVQHTGLGL
jgi:hypothetical protein